MTMWTLVTSAGLSRRMGEPKALLTLENKSLIDTIIDTALAAQSTKVIVVLAQDGRVPEGHPFTCEMFWRARSGLWPPDAVQTVGAHPQGELIDSIRTGIAHHQKHGDDDLPMLLWPVDSPFASAKLISSMREALFLQDRQARHYVVRPQVVVNQKPRGGHPTLFGASRVDELMGPTADVGAHRVVKARPDFLLNVPWPDWRLAAPLNGPDDAATLGILMAQSHNRLENLALIP